MCHAQSLQSCPTLCNPMWTASPQTPLSMGLSRPFQIFPSGTVVKNPPAMQETQVRSLGQEDPLDKEVATQSSILAWKIPWTGEPLNHGGLQPMGSQRVGHD